MANRFDGRLRAIQNFEFLEDADEVKFHGPLGYGHIRGDFLVAPPPDDEFEHFQFTFGEVLAVEPLGQNAGDRWREDGSQFSETVKLVLLAGRYAVNRYQGKHYAMARNLVPRLRAAYDEALSRYDVLVMPTTPVQATVIPAPDAPLEEVLGRALEMIANTSPLDVSGHPACSVPAGLVNGLPTGMMIMGKHFDDATVLRVANTFERAVGGFPSPPVLAGVTS